MNNIINSYVYLRMDIQLGKTTLPEVVTQKVM